MKYKRSTLIPAVLIVYLAVMATIGYSGFSAGHTSAMEYFGTIITTIAVIILLHFNLKRRERLRRERLEDMEQASKNNK
ncbi:MAG: hypothetical protein K2F63_04365 [Muribaculaceae bacterium]|nr:hypothetical protein [Muribaculaceae bacterium]MDE6134527.1 hypothetical protein [Muribaculaceae bacterium]